MAINVEIIQHTGKGRQPGSRNDLPVMPAVSITNVTAAGETALSDSARIVTIRNRTGGDSVYCLIRAAGSTQAAAGNSLLLSAGQSFEFALPHDGVGSDYEVDIRATA